MSAPVLVCLSQVALQKCEHPVIICADLLHSDPVAHFDMAMLDALLHVQ